MLRENTRFRTVAALVVLAVVGAALTGAAAAQTDSPTVRVSDATIEEGGGATVEVVLTAAPDGLAGFAVDLTVEGDGARIADAGYPDTFGLTSTPEVADDGTSVRLEAADLDEQVQPGATGVVLATVELAGESAGEATLRVEPLQFDADGGASIDPATQAGTVTVGAGGDGGETTAAASDDDTGATGDGGSSDAAAADDADGDGDETTATSFALPAGGIALTALALALVGAFAARRRR
jgi:hypothetical protein